MSSSSSRKPRAHEPSVELFQHEPLDISKPHVRLARLLPKTQDGYLRLELRNNVRLDTRPEYQALSYFSGTRSFALGGRLSQKEKEHCGRTEGRRIRLSNNKIDTEQHSIESCTANGCSQKNKEGTKLARLEAPCHMA